MSASYQIEHEQRKDEAVEACKEIYAELEEKTVYRMTQVVRDAWNIGRKLTLGANE